MMKTITILLLIILPVFCFADQVIEDDYVLTAGSVSATAHDAIGYLSVDTLEISSLWIDDAPRYIHHYDSSLVIHRIACDTVTVKKYKYEDRNVEEFEIECDTFVHWETKPVYAPKVEVYLDSVQWLRLLDLLSPPLLTGFEPADAINSDTVWAEEYKP